MKNSDYFADKGYYLALYCNIENARPNVYHLLLGVLDFQERDLHRLKLAEDGAKAAILHRDFAVESVRDARRRFGMVFRTVDYPPYSVGLVPAAQLHEGAARTWLDESDAVPLGPGGAFGTAYLETGRWPRLSEYAGYAMEGAMDALARVDGTKTCYEYLTSTWYR